jgi:hypothetical protein
MTIQENGAQFILQQAQTNQPETKQLDTYI